MGGVGTAAALSATARRVAKARQEPQLDEDKRKLGRYNRRWCVARSFTWLRWFRRLVMRFEYDIDNYFGMVRLGCLRIVLRHL